MWKSVSTAPFETPLELAVIEKEEVHALVFACKRIDGGWAKEETGEQIDVHPTHWREWQQREQRPAG